LYHPYHVLSPFPTRRSSDLFNLDGTTLYLAMASVFVAQAVETATGQHMSFGRQLVMMLTLMVTSKGVAAVPRAALVILLATLASDRKSTRLNSSHQIISYAV